MTSLFDINFCKHYHLQQELPFLHNTIYRWKISPSLMTQYLNTQLLTTKWRQYKMMITETKIELSSPSTRLLQKTPLYHSVTDKNQNFIDFTCSTHNTQNDANHGVSGLVKSLRQSMLLQDHQRQHTMRQTINLQPAWLQRALGVIFSSKVLLFSLTLNRNSSSILVPWFPSSNQT